MLLVFCFPNWFVDTGIRTLIRKAHSGHSTGPWVEPQPSKKAMPCSASMPHEKKKKKKRKKNKHGVMFANYRPKKQFKTDWS